MISEAVCAGVRMKSQIDETTRPKANPRGPRPPANVAIRKTAR